MNKVIQVKGLQKTYGSLKAVKGIDFYVKQGSLFAFLGKNGAGKSTTIDIMSTQLAFDSGEVMINDFRIGKDNEKIRSEIGIVFQDSVLDPLLTVSENLEIRGSFYGLTKIELKAAIKQATQVVGINETLW